MKKCLLFILGIIILNFTSKAQNDSGFGFYEPNKSVPCITEQQHLEIERKINESRDELVRRGILQQRNPNQIMTTLFAWPVEQTNGLNDYAVHGISNFVDHNMAFPNQILDYNCGTRSYDTPAGYNHKGTDIFTWPFSWYKMDSSQVKIVAAAPGTIIYKNDGNFDRSCASNGNNWNAVYVEHADGSEAWYGHMKNGSLTSKTVGQSVVTGEYLGIVGSSGNSTGPHLHFEIYDSGNNLIDPYSGSCNSLNATTWWTSQRPYYDSGVNALRTQSAPPNFPACSQTEIPNEKNQFCLNQQIIFAAYYRDQLNGQVSQYKVFRPDGTIWQQWTQTFNIYYAASYWYWTYSGLPSNAQTGKWKFQVVYNSQTYERYFDVNANTTITSGGSTTFCDGGSVLLQAPNSQYGFNYQWKKNGVNISNAINSTFAATTSGTYTCAITTVNGCTTTSNSIIVTVNPLPSVSFSGLASSYNVSAPPATLTGSPAGGTFSGPGISGNSFNPSAAGVGGPYTITYAYTDGNGCTNSSSQQTTVTNCTTPAQPGTITVAGGNTKVCPGDSKTYSIGAVAGATSYSWISPQGATIASGQGTVSVTVNYNAGFVASDTIRVAANNSCGTSPQRTLKITRNTPSTPSLITGAVYGVCPNTSGNYSVTNVNGMTYNWTAPAGANIFSGQGTNAVTVNFSGSFVSDYIQVTAANNCGTSSVRQKKLYSIPSKPSAITGAINNNCNTTNSYTIPAVLGATSYTWTTNIPGAVVTPNNTSASISFPSFTSGIISVTANNVCGSSASRTLTVKGTVATPPVIYGNHFVTSCTNEIYSIDPIPGATSYTWTKPAGSIIVSGAGTTSITVDFGTTSGNITAKGVNACGNGSAKTFAVTVSSCLKMSALNINETNTLEIHPNPFSDIFMIEYISEKIQANGYIEIYNSLGKSVLSRTIEIKEGKTQKEINLSKFPSGIYFLNFRTENEVVSRKIIKE